MVRRKIHHSEMHTTYLLKPGQILQNTKPSKRTRALMVSKNGFQRFIDYTTEEDRIAEQREKEATKIAMLKKAAYEKTKTWENTIENIKARRREELLSKRQKAEEERKMFVKEMAEKKAAERKEVVKQARKLLLQKKPLCRQINRALLTSECFRELNDQVELQKTIRAMDKEQDMKYADSIKTDVAKYEEQKRQEAEERAKKTRDYRMNLKKQIEENKQESEQKASKELEAEKEDQRNKTRNMQLLKEHEVREALDKKTMLRKFFKDAIEEKKQIELKLKRDEEFQDRALEIYRKAKDRIQKVHKSITRKATKERAHWIETIAPQHDATARREMREIKEQEILEKVVKEKDAADAEKRKAQKEREEAMRALVEEYKLQDADAKAKRREEGKQLRAWEMMQRFKKDEFDKQIMLEERKRQLQQKQEYGSELQKDVEEKKIEERNHEKVLQLEATSIKAATERANQRILLYGEEVLKESKDIRPLHPIVKAIKECKKEMGLTSTKKVEETVGAERPKRKHKVRRICTKSVPAERIYIFQ